MRVRTAPLLFGLFSAVIVLLLLVLTFPAYEQQQSASQTLKQNAYVKDFLDTHDDAQFALVRWSGEQVERAQTQIFSECEGNLDEKEYFRVEVTSDDAKKQLVLWVDQKTLDVHCVTTIPLREEGLPAPKPQPIVTPPKSGLDENQIRPPTAPPLTPAQGNTDQANAPPAPAPPTEPEPAPQDTDPASATDANASVPEAPPSGPACADTDGNVNYYARGTLTATQNGADTNYTDTCLTSTTLQEHYCLGTAQKTLTITCPVGTPCQNGACTVPEGEPQPECGNAVIEVGEQCDGNALGSQSCTSLGFDSGTLSCDTQCAFDTTDCAEPVELCGNGTCDAGETLTSCPTDCKCGNGVIDTGEQCDGSALGTSACAQYDPFYAAGSLSCKSDCTYNTVQCVNQCGNWACDPGENANNCDHDCDPTCNNNVTEQGEQCDGTDLPITACSTYNPAIYDTGETACNANCTYNTSACMGCGDGTCNNNENANTCPSDCDPECGNDAAESGEACDGADLRGETCTSQGFVGGGLFCTGQCTFDTAWCTLSENCGNNALDAGEQCEYVNQSPVYAQAFACDDLGKGAYYYTDAGAVSCTVQTCLIGTGTCTRDAVSVTLGEPSGSAIAQSPQNITLNIIETAGFYHPQVTWTITNTDTGQTVFSRTQNYTQSQGLSTTATGIPLGNYTWKAVVSEDGQSAEATQSFSRNTYPLEKGDGTDGSLSVSGTTTVNAYTHVSADLGAGATQITVENASAFGIDDEVLVLQVQDPLGKAGNYEFVKVTAKNGNTLTVYPPLSRAYTSGTFDTPNAEATQVIRVPQYTDVTVNGGAQISATPWNGYEGGVVAFRAMGTVTVNGTIRAEATGFRGGTNGPLNGTSGQGESYKGAGSVNTSPNAGGGGGATNSSSNPSGTGGGGGYGTGGGAGGGQCIHCYGRGGAAYGSAELAKWFLGSGGGGDYGAAGGAGGGLVFIFAETLTVNGTINANGKQTASSGGSGGSIVLYVNDATLGEGKVHAVGPYNGGLGRIYTDANTLFGTTNPAAYTP